MDLFNDDLPELNEDEKTAMQFIIEEFKCNIEKFYTNDAISNFAERIIGVKLNSPRIRKILNHIRVHRLVDGMIIGTWHGYKVTNDRELMEGYLESLSRRINKQQYLRAQCFAEYQRIIKIKKS